MSPPAAALDAEERRAVVLLCVLLAASVLLGRFVIPVGGGIPVALPIVLAAFAWGLRAGVLRTDPLRVQLYLLAVGACLAACLASLWRGVEWSLPSLAFLILTYLLFVAGLRRPTRGVLDRAGGFFLGLVAVGAVLALVQMGAQLAGLGYPDPISRLPTALVSQDYVTTYPIVYGSDILKANGMIFLEASFLSQFCALALVLHVYLGRRGPAPLLYLGALVAAVSGTGIILAIVGFAALLAAGIGRRLLPAAALGGVAVAIILVTPLGAIFLDRASSDTGSTPRFVTPYAHVADTFGAYPVTALVGSGAGNEGDLGNVRLPGADTSEVPDVTGAAALPPVVPVIPKLILDYGLPAAAIFLVFVLTSVLSPGAPTALAAPLLVLYLTLSGNLLNPSIVTVMLVFTALFAVPSAVGAPISRARPSDVPT